MTHTTSHHARFVTVKETEKAVCLRVGFIYNENKPEVTLPDGRQMSGYFADCWVPKSCIKDGAIADWFAQKEIAPKFMRNAIMNVIF